MRDESQGAGSEVEKLTKTPYIIRKTIVIDKAKRNWSPIYKQESQDVIEMNKNFDQLDKVIKDNNNKRRLQR